MDTFEIIDELDRDLSQSFCTARRAKAALLAMLKDTVENSGRLPRRLAKHAEAHEAYELAQGHLQAVAEKAWHKESK